jgi:anaerobic selenocysteine-containing dehydrogenase
MMRVIINEGLYDRQYVDEHTLGFSQLREHVQSYTPERVTGWTGVAAGDVEHLAREYATNAPAAIRLNYGVQRSQNGGASVRAVAMLPALIGAWKHLGGGLQLSTSGAFHFNKAALERPDLMWQSPLGRAARVVNMSRLGHALTDLGAQAQGRAGERGDTTTTGEAGQGPRVMALFVYNSNPGAIAPNQNAVVRGLMRSDLFTVVHEQFFTDTTDYADVVLPATTFLEHKDIQGAYGHYYVQLSDQAIAPLGEARSNVWLFAQLAQRMGFTEACFRDSVDDLIGQALAQPVAAQEDAEPTHAHVNQTAVSQEAAGQTAAGQAANRPSASRSANASPKPSSNAAWMRGITMERLRRERRVRLQFESEREGRPFLPFSSGRFSTPSGKVEFYSGSLAAQGLDPLPAFHPPEESRHGPRSAEYPLEMLARKADNYMNSTFANLPAHQAMESKSMGVLEIHASDAAARQIADGDAVVVWNARGQLRLRARVSGKVARGVVAASLTWNKLTGDGSNVNVLTSERLTDIGGGPTFYSTLVEVEKAGPG